MPPKLRKDKLVQSPKPTPTSTSNQFGILSDHPKLKDPPRSHSTTTAMGTKTQPGSDTPFESLKTDLATMTDVIKSLATSIHKMDKLAEDIESCQKSTDSKLSDMFTELRSELDDLKTNTTSSSTTGSNPPSYATIVKTTRKSNKNDDNTTTPKLETLKPTTKLPATTTTSTPVQALVPPTTTTDSTPIQALVPISPNDPNKPSPIVSTTTMTVTNTTSSITAQQGTTTTVPTPNLQAPTPTPPKLNATTMAPPNQTTSSTPLTPAPINQTSRNNTATQQPSPSNTTPYHKPSFTTINNDTDEDDTKNDNNTSDTTSITIPSRSHRYWRLAASEAHHPRCFLQYMDNIKLHGDTISNLCQFYECIRLAFHSSFSKPVNIYHHFETSQQTIHL